MLPYTSFLTIDWLHRCCHFCHWGCFCLFFLFPPHKLYLLNFSSSCVTSNVFFVCKHSTWYTKENCSPHSHVCFVMADESKNSLEYLTASFWATVCSTGYCSASSPNSSFSNSVISGFPNPATQMPGKFMRLTGLREFKLKRYVARGWLTIFGTLWHNSWSRRGSTALCSCHWKSSSGVKLRWKNF